MKRDLGKDGNFGGRQSLYVYVGLCEDHFEQANFAQILTLNAANVLRGLPCSRATCGLPAVKTMVYALLPYQLDIKSWDDGVLSPCTDDVSH